MINDVVVCNVNYSRLLYHIRPGIIYKIIVGKYSTSGVGICAALELYT